ncbi:Small ubiquitin-related modifier, SUMO [Cordyceps fumosorosea ARSEF 2679]|uniref:Small ubiquitin-related modifier, SUMO n=1 Tax=Cordyceps fumosorosea (strain ARSEF 2679) TaxID=1081104 RepID=A0A167LG20_CORFA|nr:Small ubiquitin-related modifier, SUMO [Cordyceps fumosorosea ARSEF 2679]OAA53046.1 Small ubiquitin-related modifier, SUMO [Cordyceps fumosorosea ARSEF 2679]
MGCCFSRSAGPNSPYPGGIPNASARHINPPPLSLGESAATPVTAANPASPRRRRRRDRGPIDEHINKPLRRHVWASVDRQWTRKELDTERAEYFDTRVTARSEIWQTLHGALQVLWEPPTQETNDNGQTALQTAQSMLNAAEISLPTGNLVNGAYDSFGNFYPLPEWVVSDPQNIIEHDQDRDGLGSGDDETQGDGEGAEMGKEEKGKNVDEGEPIQVRARLSEAGNDISVSVSKTDVVRNVIRKLAAEAKLSSTKKIRLAYMGKLLKETATLEAQGWQDGHIVNALIFNR